MAYLQLPSSHYASGWGEDREIRDFATVTNLGVKYIDETDPQVKQDLLLELVRCFHSYIFKYVTGIVSGALPKHGLFVALRMFRCGSGLVFKRTVVVGNGLGKLKEACEQAFRGGKEDFEPSGT
jgi:hypothetical protein